MKISKLIVTIALLLLPVFSHAQSTNFWSIFPSYLKPLFPSYGVSISGSSTISNLSIQNATTTRLVLQGFSDGCLQVSGSVVSSLGAPCGSGGGGGGDSTLFTWSPTTNIISTDGASTTATTSISTNNITLSGNSTTTGSAYLAGRFSIGTTSNTHLINVDGAAVTNATDLLKITAPSGYSGGGGSYLSINNNTNTQQWAINSFGNMTVKNGSTFTGSAGTAPANGLAVFSPTGSQNGLVIKGGASYVGDYIRILDNSNNILLNFSGTSTFLGVGSSSPTRMLTVGGDIFTSSNITAASSTLGFASSSALTVSGNTYLSSLTGLLKGTSGLVSAAANGTDYTLISGTTCTGNDKVSAVSASGVVTCSADQTGGGGGSDVNWTAISSAYLRPATSTYGISVAASSTIGGGTGLTVDGNSTTTGDVVLSGASSTVVNLVETIGFTVDGGSSVITTGVKGYVEIPYDATIVGWTALSTDSSVTSGTTTIDVWKDSYANYPPDSSDSIFTSTKVNIRGATKGQSTSTPSNNIVTEGDIIGFNVDSVSALKRVTVILKIKRR